MLKKSVEKVTEAMVTEWIKTKEAFVIKTKNGFIASNGTIVWKMEGEQQSFLIKSKGWVKC